MSVASRGTVMGAQALRKAGESINRIMRRNALELGVFSTESIEQAAGAAPGALPGIGNATLDDIILEGGFFYNVNHPQYKKPFGEVCNSCIWTGKQMAVFEWYIPEPCELDHSTNQGTAFPAYAFGCVVAEVEVDTETGYVDVVNVTSSHDAGLAVNPALAKGQVYGGIAMGAGYGVMEEMEVRDGMPGQSNMDTYIIPTAMDAPEMTVNLLDSCDETGTYGAKSIGEPATEAVAAAIANAVYNATGRRIRENPADLEKVLLGKKLR